MADDEDLPGLNPRLAQEDVVDGSRLGGRELGVVAELVVLHGIGIGVPLDSDHLVRIGAEDLRRRRGDQLARIGQELVRALLEELIGR